MVRLLLVRSEPDIKVEILPAASFTGLKPMLHRRFRSLEAAPLGDQQLGRMPSGRGLSASPSSCWQPALRAVLEQIRLYLRRPSTHLRPLENIVAARLLDVNVLTRLTGQIVASGAVMVVAKRRHRLSLFSSSCE